MKFEEIADLVKEEIEKMSDKELQDWCDSQECYDYLNR